MVNTKNVEICEHFRTLTGKYVYTYSRLVKYNGKVKSHYCTTIYDKNDSKIMDVTSSYTNYTDHISKVYHIIINLK